MIDNSKVIVIERPYGSVAVSVTNGSDNFHDGIIMVEADNKDGDDLIDVLESVLFYAAKRIMQLEKDAYSPPPSSESECQSGVGKREKGQDY
ncbi:MAG: hypothetical protein EKE12_00205 [Candidatus Symbiopectobacterium sp. Clec_Harlan]|nr:hypothetical protein [Candidatus Symbiopectobacterium sp. Clec_Harlan]